MPQFEIEVHGRTFEIEAPSSRDAITAARKFVVSTPPASTPMAPSETPNIDKFNENRERYVYDAIGNVIPSAGRLIRDTAMGIAGLGKQLWDVPEQAKARTAAIQAGEPDPGTDLGRTITGLVPAMIDTVKDRFGSIDKTVGTLHDDPAGVIADVAGAVSAAGAIRAGARSTLGRAATRAVTAVPRGAVEAVKRTPAMVSGAASDGLAGGLLEAIAPVNAGSPVSTLVQALKPTNAAVGFERDVTAALPKLQQVAGRTGRPITDADALLNTLKTAKAETWQEYTALAGSAPIQVDLTPVAKRMVDSIPKKTRMFEPETATRIESRANLYKTPMSLDDAEDLLRTTNAELDAYYAKFPGAQRAELAADPTMAHTVAEAEALREAITAAIDNVSGLPGRARELRRQYGALSSVERETLRRYNVARRQQPESLAEQMAIANALTEGAGPVKLATAKTRAKMARLVKERQAMDALIRRAFGDSKVPAVIAKGTP